MNLNPKPEAPRSIGRATPPIAAQPNGCSVRLRFCWLIVSPGWCVVRASIAFLCDVRRDVEVSISAGTNPKTNAVKSSHYICYSFQKRWKDCFKRWTKPNFF